MKYIETKKIFLKDNPEIFEKNIQDLIIDSPSRIGLKEYYAHDRERIQLRGGRLDILLVSQEDFKNRVATEVQLGKLDSSHLFRSYEYYLNEKEKYPNYELSSLLICEEGNDRLLPVIRDLFANKPFKILILNAFLIDKDSYSFQIQEYFSGTPLVVDEEVEITEKADRKYWHDRRPEGLKIVDELMELVNQVAPNYKLNYLKAYCGLSNGGNSDNFITFQPNSDNVLFNLAIEESEDVQNLIDETNFSSLSRTKRRYRIKIKKEKIKENKEILLKLISLAHQQNNS